MKNGSELCFTCRREEQMKNFTPSSVLPQDVPRVIVENISNTSRIRVSSQSKSLFLFGPAGCGKSHAAACLMFKEMRTKDPSSFKEYVWSNVPRLLFALRQTYISSEKRFEEALILQKLTTARLVCLDDFGAEKTTDWSLQTLYLIINERYENKRATIITSNLSLDEIAERLGDDRLSSRIAGMCEVIEIKGKDRRVSS